MIVRMFRFGKADRSSGSQWQNVWALHNGLWVKSQHMWHITGLGNVSPCSVVSHYTALSLFNSHKSWYKRSHCSCLLLKILFIGHILQSTGLYSNDILTSFDSTVFCWAYSNCQCHSVCRKLHTFTTKSHVALSSLHMAASLCSLYVDCTSIVWLSSMWHLKKHFLLYHLNRPIMYRHKDIGQSSMNHFPVFFYYYYY